MTDLPLITDGIHTPQLAAWAAARIPHVGETGFGACWAVGVVRDAALAAAVVFHDYQPLAGTAQISCAADTPRWASREVIGHILGLGFGGALGVPLRKVWIVTPSTNERALRFCTKGVGMKQEAILRHHFAPKVHAVICSLLATEYRRRYGG